MFPSWSHFVAVVLLWVSSTSAAPVEPCPNNPITASQYDDLRKLLLKTKGYLTQGWKCYSSGNVTSCSNSTLQYLHPGVDYGTSGNSETVYAPSGGIVTRVTPGNDCSSINCLSTLAIYDQVKDVTYVFLHMKSITPQFNKTVLAGDPIGTVGSRGANAIHLHFEVRPQKQSYAATCVDKTVNPYTNTVTVVSPPGKLLVSFNPNPVSPQSVPGCSSFYAFTLLLTELNGTGVNLTTLQVDQFSYTPVTKLGLPTHLNGRTTVGVPLSWCRSGGVSTWTVTGVDDNGTTASWAAPIQFR